MNEATEWLNADRLTAISTTVAAIAAAFAVLVAWVQLRDAVGQYRSEVRPYVVGDVVPGLHGAGTWDLIVQNRGRSIARNLTLSVDNLVPQGDDDYIQRRLTRLPR